MLQGIGETINKKLSSIGPVWLGALFISSWVFYNNYPLMYPDTGTYLRSGFEGYYPLDRPVFYGWFVRHVSLKASLYLPVFVQALLCSWLIFLSFKAWVGGPAYKGWALVSTLILGVFSSLGFHAGMIMPDIFTAFVLWVPILLMWPGALNKQTWWWLSVLWVFALLVHTSHLMVALALMGWVGLFLRNVLAPPISRLRAQVQTSLLGLAFVLVPSVHWAYTKTFRLTDSAYLFRMNRLFEWGIAQDYLKHCSPKQNSLAKIYHENPGYLNDFLWGAQSPLAEPYGWVKHEAEYEAILDDVMSQSKYRLWFTRKTLECGVTQLFQFESQEAPLMDSDAPPSYMMRLHFPHELGHYYNSMQNKGLLDFSLRLLLFRLLVFSSIALLIWARYNDWVSWKFFSAKATLLVGGLVANAFVCAAFSTVTPRYQSRVMWLLPLLALLVLAFRHRQQLAMESEATPSESR